MNGLDFIILIGSILGIALYGIWHTRSRQNLESYLRGNARTPWLAIGISVMATQASAITFLSTPGQGYLGGLGLVQMYFGVPIALLIIAIFFLPIYRQLNVYTAYEYLGKRFDSKTRLLGTSLFLIQRGLGAGLTVYAPAIMLSSVFGWSLTPTIISCGLIAVIYTAAGGSEAVTVTQKYQLGVIFFGMIVAFILLLAKLSAHLNITDALTLAGGFQKLKAVNLSVDPDERYTLWSGVLGGTFLMLSYFGTDQSQVQRYISGSSLRESRLGLMFNAICKIPMQLAILFLGVFLFVFYSLEPMPLFFNSTSMRFLDEHASDPKWSSYEVDFRTAHAETSKQLEAWLDARHRGDVAGEKSAFSLAIEDEHQEQALRDKAGKALSAAENGATANDADYVFITFIFQQLPHGIIGLLVTAFAAAALSSKAAELNALGATTTMDVYRVLSKRTLSDVECLTASRWFTVLWGLAAIIFALSARLAENLIQAVNILGSIFYGVILGLFIVGFFVRSVGGTAVFWAALLTQLLIFVLYFNLKISFLWFLLIGAMVCLFLSLIFQYVLGPIQKLKETS